MNEYVERNLLSSWPYLQPKRWLALPEHITREEVQRVCQELAFRDWTSLSFTDVLPAEARALQEMMGAEAVQISTEAFQRGLEIELEHGLEFADANVTDNHPVPTAKIVLAHLKEMLDYYERLEVAELEGDLLRPIPGNNVPGTRRIVIFWERSNSHRRWRRGEDP